MAVTARALAGLLLLQVALPKFLPLPGITEQWVVILVGGGMLGVIASLVGGVVVLAYAVSLLPQTGWSAWHWGTLAAAVAAFSRLVAVLLVSALTNQPPTRYPWGASLPLGVSLLVALALVALVYGVLTAAAVTFARRATPLAH